MIFKKLKIETKDIIIELKFISVDSLIRSTSLIIKRNLFNLCYIIYWDVYSTKNYKKTVLRNYHLVIHLSWYEAHWKWFKQAA